MSSDRPPTRAEIEGYLHKILEDARKKGLSSIVVNAGDLHRMVGGYPGPCNRMTMVCGAMRRRMQDGDEVLDSPPSGDGASVKIRYRLNADLDDGDNCNVKPNNDYDDETSENHPNPRGSGYKLDDNSFPHALRNDRCNICKKNTPHWLHVDGPYYLFICTECGFYQKYVEND